MWKWAALLIIPVALLVAIALSSGSDEANAIPGVENAQCGGILEVLENLGNHPVLWPLALAGYFILFNLLQSGVDGAVGPAGIAVADIDLSGPSPVIPVNGSLSGNGSVEAFGTGTYAGFQTSVQFSGQIQFDQAGIPQQMTGTYIVGGHGELPGEQPIVYGLTCIFNEYSITVLKLNSATHGPIAGWGIELFGNDDCSGTPIDSGVTDNDGLIDFTGLVGGTYSLKEENRAGFMPDGELCQTAFVGDAVSAASGDNLPPCPTPNLPFPDPGCDEFDSGAQVNIDFSPIGGTEPEIVTLNGPTRIHRGPVSDADSNGRDDVQTEIIGMSLEGATSVGPATVMQSPTRPSDGAFEEQNNAATGTIDFPADSFFDVFVEIDLPQMNMVLHNTQPIRMECIIDQIPPEFCLYQPPVDHPIQLYNEQNQLVALIVHAAHIPLPPHEILVVFNNTPPQYSITVLKLNSATHGPLGGWEIELFGNDDCSGSPIDSGVTDNNGLIDFTGLVEGTYSLKEGERGGFTPDGDLCQTAFVGDAVSAASADDLPPCPPNPQGCDEFDSGAQVNIDFSPISGTEPEIVTLNGPTRIHRGPVADGDSDGRDDAQTEIIGMSLTGTTSVGPATVMQSPTRPSNGAFEEKENVATGTIDFPADSFFDVFVEVDLPQTNMVLHNTQPIRMECIIFQIPPEFCLYQPPVDDPIELFNEQNQLIALIVHAAHIPLPPNEILIVFNNSPGLVQGNVDCNVSVNSVDSLKLLRWVALLSVSQEAGCPLIGAAVASFWGDVDCSGTVNSVDALKILRYVALLSVLQPDQCPDIGAPILQ